MDVGRLRKVVKLLVQENEELGIEAKLNSLVSSLNNLVSSPGEPAYQQAVSSEVRELSLALARTQYENDPTFRPYVDEIAGNVFFSKDLTSALAKVIQENPTTPAVAQAEINQISSNRSALVARLRQMNTTMNELGLGEEELDPGTAQIGFRIPRGIFDNQFDGWIEELRDLNRIIRAFSELVTGSVEPVELGDISTTDPLIFVGLAAPTVAALGAAVSWCLDQWKKVEEIRKLRAETAKLNDDTDGALADMVQQWDERIASIIDKAIEQHSKELVNPPAEPGRPHEQVNEIAYALRGILARVERGMTVELKFLPPPVQIDDDVNTQAFEELEQIVPSLAFPAASPAPVIALLRQSEPPVA